MSLRRSLVVILLSFGVFLGQALAQATQSAAAPSAGKPYPVMSNAALERARQLTQDFEKGNIGPLWAALSPQMKKQYGSAARLSAMSKALEKNMGGEKKVLLENSAPSILQPQTDYTKLSQYTNNAANVLAFVALNEQGEATMFLTRPVPDVSEGARAGYQDKTKFHLPFSASWFVYQGGRSFVQNPNFGNDDERYALEFVMLKDWTAYTGDGSKNEQFYCFGQPLLATADGTVIRVQNGFADNVPGKPARDDGDGNLVVLFHGNNEYSMLTNVKQNSIKVKRGDKVKQGDPIAECGSSGNSPAPHIAFRVQNSSGFPLPQTLPVQFVDYVADGKAVASGEPLRGQTVSNGAAANGNASAAVTEKK